MSAVCEYVATRENENVKLPLLKEYLKRVKTLLQKQSATIETSGELSSESVEIISNKIRSRLGEKAEIKILKNPKLLGGIKVKCGDDVFEYSIANELDALK